MPLLRLSPTAAVIPASEDVLLRSDLGVFRLKGRDVRVFLEAMLPLLDGTRDQHQIVRALESYQAESVLAFLDVLRQQGIVETVPPPEEETWRPQEHFFQKWSGRGEEMQRRLRESRVLIVGLEAWSVAAAGELAAAGVGALHLLDSEAVEPDDLLAARLWEKEDLGANRARALARKLERLSPSCQVRAHGLALDDGGCLAAPEERFSLLLVGCPPDDLKLQRAAVLWAHRHPTPYLPFALDGIHAVAGPHVTPGEGPCWNCARMRQLANAADAASESAIQEALLAERPPRRARTCLAPMAAAAGMLAALESLKILAGYAAGSLGGRILRQNLVSLETNFHVVVPLPWCDICGGAAAGGSTAGPGGQGSAWPLDQVNDPAEFRRRMAGWVDERTGVIRYLSVNDPDAAEPDLPVTATAVLGRFAGNGCHPAEPEIGSGKGMDAVQAMLSAVGEAIERYSAARFRRSDLVKAPAEDLQGEKLDPREIGLYEPWQYEQQEFPFSPYRPEQPLDWVQGAWFGDGRPVWMPALPTFFNFPAPPEERFCQVTSNGLAAGRDPADAAFRATLELIERDAFMLTWLCRLPVRRLLPGGALDAPFREALRQLEALGVAVELYLLDAGLQIPVVCCLALGDGVSWPGVTAALGCHPDPVTAATKAILEQGHVGPYLARLLRGGEQAIPDEPDKVRSLIDHAFFYVPLERRRAFDFLRGGQEVSLSELPRPSQAPAAFTQARLKEAGLAVAVADVTAPDVRLSPFRVARAIGVHMQQIHFGHRFARLANPRLRSMCPGPPNPDPHPLA